MSRKFLQGAAFAVLLIAGAITASAVAGAGPLRVTQTESSSTSTVSTSTSTTTTTTTTAKKITICHHAASKAGKVKHVTIKISNSAWPAHKRHGDSLGACTAANLKKFHSSAAHIKKFHHSKKKKKK
jgi:hypothetical protein